MKYKIIFEFANRRLQTTIKAENKPQAEHKLYGKIYKAIKIIEINKQKPKKNNIFESLKNIINDKTRQK